MSVMATTHETASPPFAHNAERWAAVVRRDGHTDGLFYYAVQTTGVYCRPSCPARLAQREHAQFLATYDAAEQAGFRPCKRCCPNAAALAKAAGMSRYHFHRVFTAITGVTPKAYAAAHRAQRVRDALSRTATVTEAIYRAGFHSHGRFYATSSEVLGMTPTHLRSGGHGTTIWFAIGECSLGAILVAKSDRGVCAIPLGDDPDELARDLQDRFPRANLIGDDGAFEQLVAQVVDFVEAPGIGLDLPLDVRGTAFQQRVWQALREIPAGETASYTDIANRIGSPNSVRAVAQACAANAPAVAIPCHRVVPQRWRPVRLSLGHGTQARAAGKGGTRMYALMKEALAVTPAKDVAGRVKTLDWERVSKDLEAQGCAMIEGLITPEACDALAGLYPVDGIFRRRVVMGRHGFGRGEYKYFCYPLPDMISGLRTSIYPHLVPMANRWNTAMGIDVRYPAKHADFIARCHDAGQLHPTPLLLQYEAGDYNCLHQDLYGEHVFPFQVTILLSEPGRDFTGGEFVLTERRPRMQSRPEVVPLRQGDAVVFAVHHRPVQGTHGVYRVNLHHGVSRLRSGHRHTVGIIFHDAT